MHKIIFQDKSSSKKELLLILFIITFNISSNLIIVIGLL